MLIPLYLILLMFVIDFFVVALVQIPDKKMLLSQIGVSHLGVPDIVLHGYQISYLYPKV